MAGFNSGLNGMLYVTRERFDSAEFVKVPMTLYIVDNGESISIYLGAYPLQGDGGSGGAPIGVLTELPFEAKVVQTQAAGTMNWIEQVEEG